MEEKKYLTFYKSYYEALKNLDDSQRLQMYEAIFRYYFEDKEINFEDNILACIWKLIKPNIDATNSKRLAGVKGAKIKKNNSQATLQQSCKVPKTNSASNLKQNAQATLQQDDKQPKQNNSSNTDTDTDIDTEKEKEKETAVAVAEREKEKGNAIFSPTTTATTNKVFKFYLNNINPMPTPHEAEMITTFQNETSEDLIIYAMEKAVEKKARNISYVNAILNSWKSKGITTVEEAKEESNKANNSSTPILDEDTKRRFFERNKDK